MNTPRVDAEVSSETETDEDITEKHLYEEDEEQLMELHETAHKRARDDHFMAPMAAMFNTEDGFVAFMLVCYTNEIATTYKVAVVSMPAVVWYNTKGRPDRKHTELETRSYFGSNEEIRLHPEIPYVDFCAILQRTPFKPRPLSKNERWNRANFLIVSRDEFKRVERANEVKYPNRPRALPLIPGIDRCFTDLGNNVAYTQAAPDDLSSSYYEPFQRSFTADEMALVPAMGRSWTKEALDIPIIRSFFGITEKHRGKCHIVGGRIKPATIKTHAEARADDSESIKRVMKRRLKRAKYRNVSSNRKR